MFNFGSILKSDMSCIYSIVKYSSIRFFYKCFMILPCVQKSSKLPLKGEDMGSKNVKIDLMCGKEKPVEKFLMLEHSLLSYSFRYA